MTKTEKMELRELDQRPVEVLVMAHGEPAVVREYESEWKVVKTAGIKQIRGNRQFIENGQAGYAPFQIVLPGRGDIINAYGLKIDGQATLMSKGVPQWCGKSSVWLETEGEVHYLPNPPKKEAE